MPWLIARYQPVGLFSLKHGEATSTGGKSLLIPTPFSIRMALLDAALRVDGRENAEDAFKHIQSVQIAIAPPRYAAVSGLFGKILKPPHSGKKDKEKDDLEDVEQNNDTASNKKAMTPTIAFREYVHLWDELRLAFGGEQNDLQAIARWLPHITYLGKRGGFVQLLAQPTQQAMPNDELPANFILLRGFNFREDSSLQAFSLGLLQRVDEWGASLTFEKANVFDEAKISVGKDRLRMDVILPYRMEKSGRGFTLYCLVD